MATRNANGEPASDRDKSSRELEHEIDSTRERIDHTLDELEARLSPGQLLDQAVHFFRRNGPPEFARNLGRTINENPLPVVLSAGSLAWLMVASSRSDGAAHHSEAFAGDGSSLRRRMEGAAEGAGDALAGARESGRELSQQARGAAASASQRTRRLGEGAADTASRIGESTAYGARRARRTFEQTLENEPLLAGAATFALGALFGALLPPTRTEDEAFGAYRDEALERAAERGAEQTRQAAQSVEETAREQGRRQRDEAQPDRPGAAADGPSAPAGAREQERRPEPPGRTA